MTDKKKIVARLELRPRKAGEEDMGKHAEAQMGDATHEHNTVKPIPESSDAADSHDSRTDTPISVDVPERQPERAAAKKPAVAPKSKGKVAGTPDLDKSTDPEEIDFAKELSDYEKQTVTAALALLEARGIGRIEIAGGTAKMFDPGQPDEGPDYDAAKSHVEKAYSGNQSENDNTYFKTKAPDPETGMGGSAKTMTISAERIAALAAEKKLIIVSSDDLQKFVAREAEKAAKSAVATVFKKFAENGYTLTREAREGIQQTGKSAKQTDIQKEMEKSDPPKSDVQDDMPFDMADPSDIDALERVDQMPFDRVNPSAQTEGRQITRDPAKV